MREDHQVLVSSFSKIIQNASHRLHLLFILAVASTNSSELADYLLQALVVFG
jgi:hypothetical protein